MSPKSPLNRPSLPPQPAVPPVVDEPVIASEQATSREPDTRETVADQKSSDATVVEKIETSLAGQDRPMERRHPTAPGAVVWFTFPLALIVVLLIVLAVFALM